MLKLQTLLPALVVAGFLCQSVAVHAESLPADGGTGLDAAAPPVENSSGTADFLDKLEFHASLSQGYLQSDTNDWVAKTEGGTFAFNELTANMSYGFTDQFWIGFQLTSRDFGPLMNNTIYLDWITADYSWRDELSIRLGRLKVPFGLYNASRDVDSARIGIFLPGGVYPERGRDTVEAINGGALYGSAQMGAAGSLAYFAGYGESPLFDDGGTAHFLYGNSSTLEPDSISSMKSEQILNIKLTYDTPLDGLRLAGSYSWLKNFSLDARSSLGGVANAPASMKVPDAYSWISSIEYSKGDFLFAAEYRYLMVNDQTFTFEHALAGTISIVSSTPSSGWYISGSYHFTEWFAAEVYYTELYPDDDDRDGERFLKTGQKDFLGWQKDIGLTGRFDITNNWIFKAGVIFSDGLAGGFPADYPAGSDPSQNWILYQGKITFVF